MWTFRIIWILIFVAILVVECIALFNGVANDTLSRQVWYLRETVWGRAGIFALWLWLTYHWFLEPDGTYRYWHDDILVVIVGVLLAFIIDYAQRM